MNKKWTPITIVGLILSVLSLICIIIAIFQEGSVFLTIGLVLVDICMILMFINSRNNK